MKYFFALLLFLIAPSLAWAQVFEETIPPGANFDKADFRFWFPADAEKLRGVQSSPVAQRHGVRPRRGGL